MGADDGMYDRFSINAVNSYSCLGAGERPEAGGQRSEVRGQRSEDRKKSEVRGRKSEVGGQREEDSEETLEVRGALMSALQTFALGWRQRKDNFGFRNREPARKVGVRRTNPKSQAPNYK